jgi:two-component system phosphate regulon response regulator PhoB
MYQRADLGGESVSKRVLIVEDEQDVANLVADVLSLEGFEARVASGETAMTTALSFQPSVVLLDLMMPVVDGFEVARQLAGHADTRALPIIVMTAMHDAESRAAEIGTPHWLAKPFDIGELIATVEQVSAR